MKGLCESCKYFKKNKPTTPVFVFGWWYGGPDAGKCTNEDTIKDRGYDPPRTHVYMFDGCPNWKEGSA